MRIGSSSDWHLDAGMDADIEASVRQMIKIFRDEKVDLIVVPGDFFDRKSTADGRNLLRALMQELADIAPIIGCAGNHDQPGDLDIFGHLKVKYQIQIYDKPFVLDPGRFGRDCLIYILPWFTKASWQAAHPGMTKEEGDKAVSQIGLEYLKNSLTVNRQIHPDCKNILISHLMINGAKAENHQPLIGEGITFGQYDLVEAGFFAGILGHIHLKQTFANPLFFYNGSPAPLTYGENPEKYCSILDTDSGEIEWHRFKTIDRFSLELEWGKEELFGFVIREAQSRIAGARVRALLKIAEGYDVNLAKTETEKILKDLGALEAQVEPQVQPKELIRAVEITKAITPAAKIEAYWAANNNRPEEDVVVRMKLKLAVIEQRVK